MSAASDLATELATRDADYADIGESVALEPKRRELEQLDPAAREAAVTTYLAQARDQLAVAVEMTGPAAVAAIKAEIATAAEATKQLGLSKEIQQDAQEMVRRAEYALGKAIRAGQQDGTVAVRGQVRNYKANGLDVRNTDIQFPTDFASMSELSGDNRDGIYALSDGVEPEQLNAAIDEAKTEGNLSRANVVRKVKGIANDRLSPTEKLAKIRELADTGMTSGQIADEIGAGEPYVRNVARQNGIKITADEVLRGTHRVKVDHNHIVSHLVMTLEVVTQGLDAVAIDALDEAQTENWTDSLTQTTRALNRFVKRMKEQVQ